MTPERIERERRAFEAWYSRAYLPTAAHGRTFSKYQTGTYRLQHVQDAWQTWQARASQSDWISVKDRLPESSKRYLTFSSFYMRIVTAYYSVDRRMWLGVCRTDGITHWQPFPAPPTTDHAA